MSGTGRWDGAPFDGAKVVLMRGRHLLAYRRDPFPHLPFPGHWDLPGGGREGGESPEACILREAEEEFGLRLAPARLVWHRVYPGRLGLPAHFFAGPIAAEEIAAIRFGDEGQEWRMMPVADFLAHPLAVPHFRLRIADLLAARPAMAMDAASPHAGAAPWI